MLHLFSSTNVVHILCPMKQSHTLTDNKDHWIDINETLIGHFWYLIYIDVRVFAIWVALCCVLFWSSTGGFYTVMDYSKGAVSPALMHWRYCSLALSHQHIFQLQFNGTQLKFTLVLVKKWWRIWVFKLHQFTMNYDLIQKHKCVLVLWDILCFDVQKIRRFVNPYAASHIICIWHFVPVPCIMWPTSVANPFSLSIALLVLLEENITRKLLSLSLELFFKMLLFQVTFLIFFCSPVLSPYFLLVGLLL